MPSRDGGDDDSFEVDLKIAQIFDDASIKYAIGGSLAHGIWAIFKATSNESSSPPSLLGIVNSFRHRIACDKWKSFWDERHTLNISFTLELAFFPMY